MPLVRTSRTELHIHHTHADDGRRVDDIVFWHNAIQSEFAVNDRTAMQACQERNGLCVTQKIVQWCIQGLVALYLAVPSACPRGTVPSHRASKRVRACGHCKLPNCWSVCTKHSLPGANESLVDLTPVREGKATWTVGALGTRRCAWRSHPTPLLTHVGCLGPVASWLCRSCDLTHTPHVKATVPVNNLNEPSCVIMYTHDGKKVATARRRSESCATLPGRNIPLPEGGSWRTDKLQAGVRPTMLFWSHHEFP